MVLDLTSDQCVWSQAGVVPPRACINAFDCTTCSFDQLLQRKLEVARRLVEDEEALTSWRDPSRYAKASFAERPCRHMLTGAVPVKYCSRNFECASCPYDQMLEDAEPLQDSASPVLEPVAGFTWTPGHYLSGGHVWVRVEYGGRVRIGLDDFAARLLGPLDALTLPGLGAAMGPGGTPFELRRGDKVATLKSPVEGVVVAVNSAIEPRPGEAHRAPYGAGWLLMLEPTQLRKDLRALRYDAEASAFIEQEAARLASLLCEGEAQPYALAATGALALDDIVGKVPGADWDLLVKTFLTP